MGFNKARCGQEVFCQEKLVLMCLSAYWFPCSLRRLVKVFGSEWKRAQQNQANVVTVELTPASAKGSKVQEVH